MEELTTADAVARWLERQERPPAAVQAVDLTGAAPPFDRLESEPFPGSLFLGCDLTPATAANLVAAGAVVIPNLDVPYQTHRNSLYDPETLFAGFEPGEGQTYLDTYDHQVYLHYEATGHPHPDTIEEALARRLHDHSISDALYEEIAGRKVVAVMGAHGMPRSSPVFRKVALISRDLTRLGYLMISGGGPGVMEATHLGAWMAPHDDGDFNAALEVLLELPADADPSREYAHPVWLERAWEVRTRWAVDPERQKSIGIPTWLYGHEPPTPLATRIAKYFANSVREEGLLAVATHGVIFAPGTEGTIQEIFQDLAQNYYEIYGPAAPMILLGKEYWKEATPVWPLLEALRNGRRYRDLIAVTNQRKKVIARITRYEPSELTRSRRSR